MDEQADPQLDVAAIAARYRALSSYLAEAITALAEDARGWGFGVDELRLDRQYRWLAEVREMQRERTALEDLLIAHARQALPYPALKD
jgi:hypothetical protein